MSATDNWCSPLWFTEMLPPVDLDPCSNERSTVKARRTLMAMGTDPWRNYIAPGGSVYWNCPYSNPLPWCERAVEFTVEHGGESVGLLKLDPTTKWWAALARGGAGFYPLRKRMTFAPGPGLTGGCTANFASVVVHLGVLRHFRSFLFDLVDQGHAWRPLIPHAA